MQKLGIMIATRKEMIILDIQTWPDSVVFSIDACNGEKISKYNQPYFLDVLCKPLRSLPS